MLRFATRVARHIRRPPGVEFNDTVSEATLVLLRLLDKVDAEPRTVPLGVDLEAWLYVRTLGDTRDVYKKTWQRLHRGPKMVSAGDPVHLPAEPPAIEDRGVMDADTSDAIHKAIDNLTPSQQMVVKAYFFQGKDQDQIAKSRGMTQAAVSKIIRRALTELKWTLKEFESA
jgi:RNA polymerase sigma factor (sigma-70 family)